MEPTDRTAADPADRPIERPEKAGPGPMNAGRSRLPERSRCLQNRSFGRMVIREANLFAKRDGRSVYSIESEYDPGRPVSDGR
jgi:hypothetical protein